MDIKQSFICENPRLDVINTVGKLRDYMDDCVKEGKLALLNLDLSLIDEVDLRSICFDNYIIKNVVFSRFIPECDKKRHLFNLSFKGATLDGVAFSQTRLQQCNFDDATLRGVDFFYSELDYCRFRKAEVRRVDFRYSHVDDCTMGKFKVELGDFYYCNFRGCTNFIDSCFKNCSFTCATFENACIRMSNIPEGIVQLHPTVYTEEIILSKDWFKYNPCATFSQMNEYAPEGNTLQSRIDLAKEAMDFYKQMSGTFAGKGLNRDSNEAYRQTKKCERRYHGRMLKALCRGLIGKEKDGHGKCYHFKKYMGTWVQWALGYGYIWWAAVIWFGILVGFFTYICYDKVDNTTESISYSLGNSLGPFDPYYKAVQGILPSIESVIGILLVGFLGFIIANNIRNDS